MRNKDYELAKKLNIIDEDSKENGWYGSVCNEEDPFYLDMKKKLKTYKDAIVNLSLQLVDKETNINLLTCEVEDKNKSIKRLYDDINELNNNILVCEKIIDELTSEDSKNTCDEKK